jgi:RNA polymerase sigma-70 factor (ECF subfamily)
MERVVTEALPIGSDVDLALMAAVATGDRGAQRRLVERLGPRVRRVAYALLPSRADADDAAQMSMLEILRSASSFHVATSLAAWADRITMRITLRTAKRERSRRQQLARWLVPETLPWGASGRTHHEGGGGLEAVMARLSDDRRAAFVLRHVLGFSVEEIARLTSSPVGTVKDRLVVARKQLRHMLEREPVPGLRSTALDRGDES